MNDKLWTLMLWLASCVGRRLERERSVRRREKGVGAQERTVATAKYFIFFIYPSGIRFFLVGPLNNRSKILLFRATFNRGGIAPGGLTPFRLAGCATYP
jgi:hypothetical protein